MLVMLFECSILMDQILIGSFQKISLLLPIDQGIMLVKSYTTIILNFELHSRFHGKLKLKSCLHLLRWFGVGKGFKETLIGAKSFLFLVYCILGTRRYVLLYDTDMIKINRCKLTYPTSQRHLDSGSRSLYKY